MSKEIVEYENEFLRITKRVVPAPGGGSFCCFVKVERDVVVCAPITDDGSVILVREFRPGPGKFLLEIPGGNIDDDELPATAAAREVKEETGYSGDVIHLASTYMSAYSTAVKHIFVMLGAKKTGEPTPDDTEFLQHVILTGTEFEESVLSGELTDLDAGLLVLRELRK